MTQPTRPRDFAQTDVRLRWHADGTLCDPGRGRTYVTFAPPVPAPPLEPPAPVLVPVVRQAVDAVALTSVITGVLLVLRISLRF